ncbi:DUF2076 domain-containing protein [Microvirga aerophila]|uniref:ABC transporter substrate-binding protein n=1 Tax=Microvirga aerophila TaxID=670291 RepID=A0A512BXX8_9HYPH|nr:DUF2076 domain-containing protein [Microvirga aerophila]GEO16809.1 hypothetical protein MAE02_45050 [Microvirga aerophila]
MNDQERQVISDIFRRLEQVANQPRDPEAERLIADKLRQQPYAPYAMAQTIFIQEQALGNLQAENEQLRAELEQAQRQPQQGGGFLSSIFGGGSRPQQHDYRQPPRQASPWGGGQSPYQQPYGQPQGGMMGGGPWGGGGMMQPRGGGGFLQGALSTAAGVAGGVMIANALSHAFGGGEAEAGGEKTALADTANNAGGDQGADAGNAGITDALYGNDQGGHDDFSDFGGDGGDGGDWT